jgi:hypothetical protein
MVGHSSVESAVVRSVPGQLRAIVSRIALTTCTDAGPSASVNGAARSPDRRHRARYGAPRARDPEPVLRTRGSGPGPEAGVRRSEQSWLRNRVPAAIGHHRSDDLKRGDRALRRGSTSRRTCGAIASSSVRPRAGRRRRRADRGDQADLRRVGWRRVDTCRPGTLRPVSTRSQTGAKCTSKYAQKPERGTFLRLDLRVGTDPTFPADDYTSVTINPFAFSAVGSDGVTSRPSTPTPQSPVSTRTTDSPPARTHWPARLTPARPECWCCSLGSWLAGGSGPTGVSRACSTGRRAPPPHPTRRPRSGSMPARPGLVSDRRRGSRSSASSHLARLRVRPRRLMDVPTVLRSATLVRAARVLGRTSDVAR